jgi:hypothetical protein
MRRFGLRDDQWERIKDLLLAAVRIRKSTAMWRMLVVLSSFCGEGAVVLAAVNDAARRFAVAFGHH